MQQRLFGSPRVHYVIFASAKSGTQWLQQLLGAHPQVHCAESRAFGHYLDPAHVSGTNITLESYLSTLSAYHRPPVSPAGAGGYFRALLFNLFDAIAQTSLVTSGKSIYGEKITPLPGTAATVIERLAEYNPDLRFVLLARDGRDVIVSGLVHQQLIHARAGTARGAALREAVSRRRVPQEMLEFFSDLWIESVSAGLSARSSFAHYLRLRYEDLLEDTQGQVSRLLAFLGADAGDDAVRRCVEAASFERMSGGRRRGQEDLQSVVRKGVAGDWRQWLSDEQVAWFEDRAGALLEELGYARAAALSA